uniref:dUTPase-like domain-containing protein n=1 Tax=viral metagenome TaxID=1070528 RepID=A0A6C0C678_9ZZZZ
MSHILKIKLHDQNLLPLYYNHRSAYIDDAGIDLFVPKATIVPAKSIGFVIKLNISAELTDYMNNSMSYFLVSRYSMNFTSLRCKISVMDAGYRGELSMIVDNISDVDYQIQQHQRLVQICAPDLKHIIVKIVSKLSKGSRYKRGLGSYNNQNIKYCHSKFKMMDHSLDDFRDKDDLDVILPLYLRPKL